MEAAEQLSKPKKQTARTHKKRQSTLRGVFFPAAWNNTSRTARQVPSSSSKRARYHSTEPPLDLAEGKRWRNRRCCVYGQKLRKGRAAGMRCVLARSKRRCSHIARSMYMEIAGWLNRGDRSGRSVTGQAVRYIERQTRLSWCVCVSVVVTNLNTRARSVLPEYMSLL